MPVAREQYGGTDIKQKVQAAISRSGDFARARAMSVLAGWDAYTHPVGVGPTAKVGRFAAPARIGADLNSFHSQETQFATLVETLQQADVPYCGVSPRGGSGGVLRITPVEVSRFTETIRRRLPDWYWTTDPNSRPKTLGSLLTVTNGLRVGQVVSTPRLALLVGPADWVRIEISEKDCTPDNIPAVDLVYTWVDGSDPLWQAQRLSHAGAADSSRLAAAGNSSARFSDLGELQASLRSAERYIGWARRIFLVTAAQIPTWLQRDHPQLTVVNHQDIWPDIVDLPTFSSHGIESVLHRIEGLAEHYLYVNDDVMWLRPTLYSHYFTDDGLPRVFLSQHDLGFGPPHPAEPATVSAGKNVVRLLDEMFGYRPNRRLAHAPHPQSRTLAARAESLFQTQYAATRRHRFRSIDDIPPITLAAYLGLATQMAVPGELSVRYIDPTQRRAAEQMRRILRHRDADVLCLNVVDQLPSFEHVSTFLNKLFPEPSSFEMRKV